MNVEVDGIFAASVLAQEARALLTRLDRVKPLVLHETMVPAAALAAPAVRAIERFLVEGRRELRCRILGYLDWLKSNAATTAPEHAQRKFVFLRLRFNAVLTQFDIFSEATSQRSEAETGVWLAGLDAAATDAMALPGYLQPPPVICFLARDFGGAIRRARSRLPGGGENPVALIRLPRERMLGAGIASSLAHEVGHQAADQLDLIPSLRALLAAGPRDDLVERDHLRLWRRWVSEIVADLWAVARVGVASTLGLIGLVSLPRAFVFRKSLLGDPHPPPWIRVKLSCAVGDALYPHPQWGQYAALWDAYYPLKGEPPARANLLRWLESGIPRFVDRLLSHRPRSLGRRTLADTLTVPELRPARLAMLINEMAVAPARLRSLRPSVAFAVVGQGRAVGIISPEQEGDFIAKLLRHWALRSALAPSHAPNNKRTGPANAASSRRMLTAMVS